MRILLTLIAVSVALSGCAVNPPAHRYPPSTLLEDCARPKVDVSTNAGLVDGVLSYDLALRLCNKDKAALREWAKP